MHTDAVMVRVFLFQTEEECDVCRAQPSGAIGTWSGKRHLHLRADATRVGDIFGVDHLLPVDTHAPPALVARTRKPFLTNDLLRDAASMVHVPTSLLARYRENGIITAGACPLEFREELMGVIGVLSRRPFDDQEFELLGIFADQAGMAIKSAHLFTQLEEYRDRLQVENAYLQQEIRSERGFEEIVGQSPALRSVLRKVKQVAEVETSVLLTGETGTGKELIARAIHSLSPRKDCPLIKINCGAIPHGVVESELFGHEKGAFTGALQRRIGRFELADKGTLFMDEVGELPLETQVKLLRVLQEQEFERVGSTKPMKVDVRLVAATNRDLDREVAEGRFRADLFYRLNVFPIRIPPLRERREDIPRLVEYFLAQFQRKFGKPLRSLTSESMERLRRYQFPGNIRELQNVLERACVVATGPVVSLGETLRTSGAAIPVDGHASPLPPLVPLADSERAHIRRALAAAGGRVHGANGAAEILGINPSTLRSRMQKLGISAKS